MAITINAGVTLNHGLTFSANGGGGGGGGGGGPVTYTSGVEYTLGQGMGWDAFSGKIVLYMPDWTDTVAANLTKAQPSGTVYDVTINQAGPLYTGTLTTTGAWTDEGSGIFSAPVTNVGLPNPYPASWPITTFGFTS